MGYLYLLAFWFIKAIELQTVHSVDSHQVNSTAPTFSNKLCGVLAFSLSSSKVMHHDYDVGQSWNNDSQSRTATDMGNMR